MSNTTDVSEQSVSSCQKLCLLKFDSYPINIDNTNSWGSSYIIPRLKVNTCLVTCLSLLVWDIYPKTSTVTGANIKKQKTIVFQEKNWILKKNYSFKISVIKNWKISSKTLQFKRNQFFTDNLVRENFFGKKLINYL